MLEAMQLAVGEFGGARQLDFANDWEDMP